jgi:hypothetical protein
MAVTLAPGNTGGTTSGTTTTLVNTPIVGQYADDYFNTFTLWITDGTGKDQTAVVTDYDGTTGTFYFTGGLSGGATPNTTTKWSISLSTQCVHGESSRYLMPAGFGGAADGRIAYARNTRHSTIIRWVDESDIRQRRSVVELLGYPLWAAIRPLGGGSGQPAGRRQWELIVNPRPVKADVLEFPYTVYFDRLDFTTGRATSGSSTTLADTTRTEADDYFNGWTIHVMSGTGKRSYGVVTDYDGSSGEFAVADWVGGSADPDTDSIYYVEPVDNTHPAGIQHDRAILSACLARAEVEVDACKDQGYMTMYYQHDLLQSKLIDQKAAPRTLGRLSFGTHLERRTQWRTWKDVTTSHDEMFY